MRPPLKKKENRGRGLDTGPGPEGGSEKRVRKGVFPALILLSTKKKKGGRKEKGKP